MLGFATATRRLTRLSKGVSRSSFRSEGLILIQDRQFDQLLQMDEGHVNSIILGKKLKSASLK